MVRFYVEHNETYKNDQEMSEILEYIDAMKDSTVVEAVYEHEQEESMDCADEGAEDAGASEDVGNEGIGDVRTYHPDSNGVVWHTFCEGGSTSVANLTEKETSPKWILRRGGFCTEKDLTHYEEAFISVFPYGVGGPNAPRPVRLSFLSYVQRLLFLSTRPLARDETLLPYLYSQYCTRKAFTNTYLRATLRCDERSFAECVGDVSADVVKEAARVYAERVDNIRLHRRPVPVGGESEGVGRLFRSLERSMAVMPHTSGHSKYLRSEALSMCMYMGTPTLWVTFSPRDDCCVELLELANMVACEWVPEKSVRLAIARRDAGACALNMYEYVHHFMRYVLRYDLANGLPMEVPGIAGHVKAVRGPIEEQGRLTLHAHFLVWTWGGGDFSCRLRNEEYLQNIAGWTGMAIGCDVEKWLPLEEGAILTSCSVCGGELQGTSNFRLARRVHDEPYRSTKDELRFPKTLVCNCGLKFCPTRLIDQAFAAAWYRLVPIVNTSVMKMRVGCELWSRVEYLTSNNRRAPHRDGILLDLLVYRRFTKPVSIVRREDDSDELLFLRLLLGIIAIQSTYHPCNHHNQCLKSVKAKTRRICRHTYPKSPSASFSVEAVTPDEDMYCEQQDRVSEDDDADVSTSMACVACNQSHPTIVGYRLERPAHSMYLVDSLPVLTQTYRCNNNLQLVLNSGITYYLAPYSSKAINQESGKMWEAMSSYADRLLAKLAYEDEVGATQSKFRLGLRWMLGYQSLVSNHTIGIPMAAWILLNRGIQITSHQSIPVYLRKYWDILDKGEYPLQLRGSSTSSVKWGPELSYLFRPICELFNGMALWLFSALFEVVKNCNDKRGKEPDADFTLSPTLIRKLLFFPLKFVRPDLADMRWRVDLEERNSFVKLRKKAMIPVIYTMNGTTNLHAVEYHANTEAAEKALQDYGLTCLLLSLPFRKKADLLDLDGERNYYAVYVKKRDEGRTCTYVEEMLIHPYQLQKQELRISKLHSAQCTPIELDGVDQFPLVRRPAAECEDSLSDIVDDIDYTPTSILFDELPDIHAMPMDDDMDTVLASLALYWGNVQSSDGNNSEILHSSGEDVVDVPSPKIADFPKTQIPNVIVRDLVNAFGDGDNVGAVDAPQAHLPYRPSIRTAARLRGLSYEQSGAFELMATALLSSVPAMFQGSVRIRTELEHRLSSILPADTINSSQLTMILTGGPGCGKSRVVQALKSFAHAWGLEENIAILGSTGIAAMLNGGYTYHSRLGLPIHGGEPRTSRQLRDVWAPVVLLVVDEYSMMCASDLYNIDVQLRQLKDFRDRPFGGVHIVLVGDICQLPPVKGVKLACRLNPPQSTKASAGLRLFNLFTTVISLRQNRRSITCPYLPKLLNSIRRGHVTSEDLQRINRRSGIAISQATNKETVVITPRQNDRDAVNNRVINDIHSRRITEIEPSSWRQGGMLGVVADLSVDGLALTDAKAFQFSRAVRPSWVNGRMSPFLLVVIGMRYICYESVRSAAGVCNGMPLTIQGITFVDDGESNISFDPHLRLHVIPVKFVESLTACLASPFDKTRFHQHLPTGTTVIPQTRQATTLYTSSAGLSNRPVAGSESIKVVCKQFPILPAAAITGHKCQGQTLRGNVYLYKTAQMFGDRAAWLYVALSRATSIANVYLDNPIPLEWLRPAVWRQHELARIDTKDLKTRARLKLFPFVSTEEEIRSITNRYQATRIIHEEEEKRKERKRVGRTMERYKSAQ